MTLPHWDLSNVFPGLETPEFTAAMGQVKSLLADLDAYLDQHHISAGAVLPAEPGPVVNGYLDRQNELQKRADTIWAYLYSYTTTDSYNQTAARIFSEYQMLGARARMQATRFEGWLRGLDALQPPIWEYPGAAKAHGFYLREAIAQSKYLMSEAEESLAADLALSGLNGWVKLQRTITSQAVVPFTLNGKTEEMPMPALQNLQREADPDLRRRAFEAELAAWTKVRAPLAAAMNGVKGTMNTLYRHRGRPNALQASLEAARLDEATLDAMLGAMRDSFPMFRRYLKAKAKRLGRQALPWYDLYAPAGENRQQFSWADAEKFVVDQFRMFSNALADFAATAFARNWLDAESRNGKQGGAFCMGIPGVGEPRILCNFDGSLDQVFTLAHELGHGFHFMLAKDKTALQNLTPMTLAETASIFCEALVTDAALKQTTDPQEELPILETFLQGATQVIVDISSRFQFEREVFERRAEAELSADDFCEIMIRAQKDTYGDGLDPEALHPYMWAWKTHYYRADVQFYNFPYAFGLLFGLGLYAIYQKRGAAFVPDYEALLRDTGEDTAANLAARFGIDIRSKEFWADSLKIVEARVNRYVEL